MPSRRCSPPIPTHVGEKGSIVDQRRRDPREPRGRAAQVAARARHRPHALLAAGELDGPPHRQRAHVAVLERALQRADPPGVRPLPGQLRARLPAPAVARGADRRVGARAASLRRRDGVHRLQPQPRSERWVLDRAAARRPLVLAAVRGDVRARRAGDDPRQRHVQPELPHHRLALPRRRHDGVHAGADVGAVQGLPATAVHHPPRRRRRALPLGPIPGHRPGSGGGRRSTS